MCTCITFYWTTQLLNTTLIGPWAFEGRELCVLVLHFAGPDTQHILINPVAFGERELCVFVLHSAGPDSYLALLRLARGMWRTGVICTCITFCQTRQLLNIILIGPMAFRERVLCVFVLHSAGPDSYLTLLRLARGIWRTGVICTCVTFCWTRQLSSQGRN